MKFLYIIRKTIINSKVNGLDRAKASLMKSVDELEENLERERKDRADLDKAKRKVEGELKAAHASVEELEVHKKELEKALRKKDGEISALNGKVEDEKVGCVWVCVGAA